MSSKDNPCRKFQANIFNKSKCQNCFKPRESHLLSDEDLNQAKPIYGGWLLLAPEGTNFDNPLQRSRKWQRRFFILYEHGLLRYALDEMPSTLPQGTINMNQCSDVIDGESRTGQKNSLCILTPDREHFIRAECREIINGWQEALMVYPCTNKQNQKKKRKVEPPTPQEPGPAKVTVTSSGSGGSIPCLPSSIANAERVPASRSTLWQEERWSRASTIPCSRSASCLSQLTQSHPGSSITREDGGSMNGGRKVRVESGYFSLEKTKPQDPPSQPPRPPQHLSLTSSTSLSVLHHRYSPTDTHSDRQKSHYFPSSDPLPSPGTLVSPSYSTLSSSQSSLDSEPSSSAPSLDGRGGGGGSVGGGFSGGGGRMGRPARDYVELADVPRARRLCHREAFRSDKKRSELRARTRSPGREEVARLFGLERRRPQVIEKFQSVDGEPEDRMDTSSPSEPPSNTVSVQRPGRSERRSLTCKQEMSLDAGRERSVPDVSCSSIPNFRRAKSLDRRVTESSMTPDLLNFKKGWMTKLYEDGMWKKHWFVLTDQSLRYYRDSIAEEAADMDGEIDLSTCYDVTEFPVQRNYGFQILSKEGACTLSAMTSGIRRNWIQAITKNVRPTISPPDVTRKNISLKLSVLKPSSLPEEKARAHVTLHPSSQPSPDPSPSPESPKEMVRLVQRQRTGDHAPPTATIPPSEPRKSRVRERRREGRSKTYDWSEFQPGQTEEPKRDKVAETADLSTASSSSTSSSSSSTSSLASSPISTTSSPPTSSSVSAPPLSRAASAPREEAEQERVGQLEDRQHLIKQDTHSPSIISATTTDTLKAAGSDQKILVESQDQGKMEVDHPKPGGDGSRESGCRAPDVQVEIEQRWHQVETTPLREEKQVPITTTDACPTERLPPQELAALLDKELGQTQKELARLQEQNTLLQEQLEDARGREHSAREGYVLQSGTSSPSSSPHRAPWQRFHKLNQDLQNELEAQRRKHDLAQHQVQTLRNSYTEAQDAIGRHEADIQALQAKLSSAMAEILASEQAVARMRNELKLEQERSREQEEEWGRSDATLRVQLRDSEERLREVEASLLEKSQALRHLEHQQALQRDHLREVHRLQERLAEVTGRLSATEQGQALKEERLRMEQRSMQESHDRERQSLARRLSEAEGGRAELEERLHEAEHQVEVLLSEMRDSGGDEVREEVMRLQEELAQSTDLVETLKESVCRLEEEKGKLTCRCQELINQISEADREVTKLRSQLETEEADYYSLENSYERVSEEFQKISRVLREKEEEIRQTKEMYERLVERKEKDLNEAIIKMAALGSSLEETEQKLQAKEELLCQMGQGLRGQREACSAEKDLQAKLVVAEDRIAELEHHLNALQLGYANLRTERQRAQEAVIHTWETTKERDQSSSKSLPTNTDSSQTFDACSKLTNSPDCDEFHTKRQRIRFSSIQCQKYIHSEDLETSNAENTSSDISQEISLETSQDFQPSMETSSSEITFHYCSDPEKFISIITALETKLLATEEKLRDLTQKLVDHPESPMQGQVSGAETGAGPTELNARLQQDEAPIRGLHGPGSEITAAKNQYDKALLCVESSKEKVRSILSSHCQSNADLQLHTLSEIENDLVSATLYIRQGEKSCVEHPSEVQPGEAQEIINKNKGLDEETIRLFAKTLSFEAMVLNKMAFLIQNPDSDLLQSLTEICQETERIKRSDGDCVAIVYADVLTRKLMLESAFWSDVQKMESHSKLMQGESTVVKSVDSIPLEADATVIFNTCVKSELSNSLQSLKHFHEEKLKMLKRELVQAHEILKQRESALKAIIQASEGPNLRKVIQEVNNEFGFREGQSLDDVSPPELAPYMEYIKMEEAKDMAEEIMDRHLAADGLACCDDSVESLQVGRNNLATELEKQAALLDRFSQAIESGNHPGLANVIQVYSKYQITQDLRGSSLCMREALIQAQVAYVACRLRADHERDLVRYQQTSQNMDVLVQGHARNVVAIRERYEASLQEERQGFSCTVTSLQEENLALKGEVGHQMDQLAQQQERLALLEERFQKETEELRQRHQLELSQAEQSRASTELALMETTADSQRKLEVLLVDMDTMEERHEGHLRRLEEQFQGQIRELQEAHQEEILRLHAHYMNTIQEQEDSGSKGDSSSESGHSQSPLPEEVAQPAEQALPMEEEEQGKGKEEGEGRAETDPVVVLKDRIQELETQMDTMRDELETKHLGGDLASLREKYQRDFESLKATCERGFTAMEETHHKVIEDLQRQHQREVSKLLEERERLLAEETAATIAAIEAMKNAHREEMEKNQRSQISGLSTDIDELHEQYQEELQSIQRELEVLSEQYSQKCLENAHLAQALEAERQALRQCQRENQELNAHNQELNNRLTVEITRMRSCYSGETALSPLTQGKDLYELEVLLRIKESEIQYLKQEIHSLKDELQSALRDKKYATDKYKAIYTELSIVKAKADCDIAKLTEKLLAATEALGERSVDGSTAPGYDIMKSKSNPDFLKKERSTLSKQMRGVRSKSLKEGLTVQERMKLFEAKDSRKI
ncbi:centrosome-associated protein CEP250 isoform X4 [Esox lucius]|uniref:centrosome-associated protein CEP250 isoform X4 n=1 Tax=Esox lucius TaxID=8010 RepID=UPI0014776946|nr:centrosome-associated protein CEP250 isoform X4 [Esox lucius]